MLSLRFFNISFVSVFQKPYSINHQYHISGAKLTEITEEEREKMIRKIEDAIKILERLSVRVTEKTKDTAQTN